MITTKELIKKVRFLINETGDDSGVTLITDDIRSIDDTIRELLPQAVAIVQKQCNGKCVNAKSVSPDYMPLQKMADGFDFIVLPPDYAKIVSVRLDSWSASCIEVSSPRSVEAVYKFGRKSSALSSRPVCVEDFTDDGTKILKLFPAEESDKLSHFIYEAQFEVREGLNICDDRMADAVAYVCVALLYNVFERYDASKSFISFATALYGEHIK